jgi:hypothetical protein
MMGHGCEKGLFDSNFDTVIDSNYVYLLKRNIVFQYGVMLIFSFLNMVLKVYILV